ncbi:MAG: CpaF family protein [Anaerolineales bacterium]|nr:CpaF family protein [Anaerolineales bacterium]
MTTLPDDRPRPGRLQALAQALPAQNGSGAAAGDLTNPELSKLKRWLMGRVSATFDAHTGLANDAATRREVEARLGEALASTRLALPETLRAALLKDVLNEFFGFGPIEPLLEDGEITEIMVNGPHRVYIERGGKVQLTAVHFDDDDHVRRIIDRIILPLGRRIDYDTPLVDARLPDGSRVNAVVAPVAIDGPSITIRKFSRRRLTVDDLIAFGSLTPPLAEFLKACIVAHLNVVVSGGTGSGKTTLLNVLSGFIPADERIVTIEDAAELQLHQEHVVRLEAKKPNLEGRYEVSIRDLVKNSLRMRPERIIVGECRGGEALDMLQAMNTGHDGSLTTLHANSPRDAISRMETMSLMAGLDFPLKVIREQIASAIELIVQQARLRDGSRRVTQVTEVAGMEGDTVVLQDIFKFAEDGLDADGRVVGQLRATGLRPIFTPKLETAGFRLPPEIFSTGLPTRDPRRR